MNAYSSIIRRLLSALFLILVIQTGYSQQYKSVRTNGRVFYAGSGEMHTALAVSQQDLGGGDTAFVFYTVVDTGQGLPANCDLVPAATGWLGPRMIVQDSLINLFFNEQGDTIRFRPGAALGNIYPIYHFPNGDYLEATNIGLAFDVFIDSFSRFKTIALQARNANGQAIPHPMNGKTMEFSERFGMKKGFNLWHFPNDTTTYTLIGHELSGLGQRPVNVFAVFDIRPGYEFHYVDRINGVPYQWEKQFVWEANDIGNGDTLRLLTERWRTTYVLDAMQLPIDTLFIQDTIEQTFAYADYAFLNGSHRQVFEYATDTFGYAIHRFVDSLGPRCRKDIQRPYELAAGGVCLVPLADSVVLEHYGDGLGQTAIHVQRANGQLWQRDLVYYQRGIEQWGAFIDFPPLQVPVVWAPDWQIVPNPVGHHLAVEGLHLPASYQLYGLDGKSIREGRLLPGAVVPMAGLPTGIYVLHLITREGFWVQKFLKQ